MKSIEESVVYAMDGSDKELFPFLSYILQDLWEIGSSPEIITGLIKKHSKEFEKLKALDLGCGKGAVSIRIAHELKCKCHGIDAIKEFIDEADKKAREFGVDYLCKFEVGDIRIKVNELSDFDIIILGSIGPVFGDHFSTLSALSKCLNKDGIIILDDGYIEDDSIYTHPAVRKKERVLQGIKDAGMELIDEEIIQKDEIKDSDEYIFEKLKNRCSELIKKYPDKSKLFGDYIKNQEKENDVLETKIICSTMAIKKL